MFGAGRSSISKLHSKHHPLSLLVQSQSGHPGTVRSMSHGTLNDHSCYHGYIIISTLCGKGWMQYAYIHEQCKHSLCNSPEWVCHYRYPIIALGNGLCIHPFFSYHTRSKTKQHCSFGIACKEMDGVSIYDASVSVFDGINSKSRFAVDTIQHADGVASMLIAPPSRPSVWNTTSTRAQFLGHCNPAATSAQESAVGLHTNHLAKIT